MSANGLSSPDRMRSAAIACALLSALSCARAHRPPRTPSSDLLPNPERPHEVAVSRAGDVIKYAGDLTAAGLKAALQVDDEGVRTLMVRSAGGEIGIAMDLGTWVHSRGFDVVVVDYCVSSCANYVFPAGRSKTILPGGVVAWHGDALQEGIEAELVATIANLEGSRAEKERRVAAGRAYMASMRAKQAAFFASVGVSECLCRIGNERLGARGLYFMSVQDMKRFGVDNVRRGPEREEDVADDVRERLGLSFLTLPSGIVPSKACDERSR
jgi:hypothetical protein